LTKCIARISLNIEPLLLRIEKSELKLLGRLLKQGLLAKVKRKRPVGRPRTVGLTTLRIVYGIAWDVIHAK